MLRSRAHALPPETRAVLQPMERRVQRDRPDALMRRLEVRRAQTPGATAWQIAARAMGWGRALGRCALLVLVDRIRWGPDNARVGVRLREAFQSLGGTALKLGQQLAVRVDFLPFETCQELEALLDKVPPFDVAYAIERIEAATGRPFHEDYQTINPEPIGSASIACVFRATLKDGTDVAVKVRRAAVGAQFSADMAVLSAMTRMAEASTMVRGGFFRHLRTDLEEMFLGELDFVREGNMQVGFRRYVRDFKIDWLDAPRVYSRLSSADVLVTRFVSAYSMVDVLKAVETHDRDALSVLASQGIDPAVLGERVVFLSLWSRLETAFFHADPHPGNLLVRPNNHVVLLDFGCCALSSRKTAEVSMEMTRRLLAEDISGAATLSLVAMAPLPPIDLVEYHRRTEAALWDWHLSMQMKDSEWWERTSAAMWLKLVEAVREMNVPVTMNVLRMTRATLLYDSVATRLNPTMTVRRSFESWASISAKRVRRKLRRRELTRGSNGDRIVAELSDLVEAASRGAFLLSQSTRALPTDYATLLSKGAYAASMLSRFLQALLALIALGLAVRLVGDWRAGLSFELTQAIHEAMTSPVLLIGGSLLSLGLFLRLRARLEDADPGD